MTQSDPVPGTIPRYAGDALRAEREIPVRQHHALRPPRAARRIEDRGNVVGAHCDVGAGAADADGQSSSMVSKPVSPSASAAISSSARSRSVTSRQAPLSTRMCETCAAFEDRVDRHDHGADASHREHRRDCLDGLRRIDRDPVARLDAARDEARGNCGHQPVELGIAQPPSALEERRCVRRTTTQQRIDRASCRISRQGKQHHQQVRTGARRVSRG